MKFIIKYSFLFMLFGCHSNESQKEISSKESADSSLIQLDSLQLAQTEIQLIKPEEKMISRTFQANGIIDVPPQNMVSVSMPLGGYLKTTKLLPGMHFNKGEVIATMEDPKYIELQQDFLISKGKMQLLQLEYERQKELNASKASSDKVFQQAKEAYESASITYHSFAQKIQLIGLNPNKLTAENISRSVNIYAPITGFVSHVNVNIGKYVNPTDILFELVNPEDIHLSIQVFEKDLEFLYMGQNVSAYTNNHPENKYPCEIILIGKDIGSDRSVNVHCHFKKYDKTLIPGTYMNATIAGIEKNALILPPESIIHDGENHYVFIQKQAGTFEKVTVKTGIEDKTGIEIVDAGNKNLKDNLVVVKGAYTLWMKLNNVSED